MISHFDSLSPTATSTGCSEAILQFTMGLDTVRTQRKYCHVTDTPIGCHDAHDAHDAKYKYQ